MRKPRALCPGDRLAIVSPASPFVREEFDRGVEEIRRLGFEPVYDDSVFARQRYVSGPPAVRAAGGHFDGPWSDRTQTNEASPAVDEPRSLRSATIQPETP